MTNKLKLKRTPEEEEARRLRKEKKRAKRRRRESEEDYGRASSFQSNSKRTRVEEEEPREPERKWASSDDDEDDGEEQFGPQPAASSSSRSRTHRTDHDHDHARSYEARLQAEIEDRLFREKLFDNLEDDERLDAVEARLNDFAHVPDRWRTGGGGSSEGKKERRNFYGEENDEFLKLDPRYMDDEEYAEWIRVGMYRKTHKDEYEEQQRQKAAQAARKAQEKARRVETKRSEKEAEEERRRKRKEKEERRVDWAREAYQVRWGRLLGAGDGEGEGGGEGGREGEMGFDDVPWPVAAAYRDRAPKEREKGKGRRHAGEVDVDGTGPGRPISVDDLTGEAISSFLLPVRPEVAKDRTSTEEAVKAEQKKARKDRLREAFLRFHPDKFEGRLMGRVREAERERVREAIGQVSRVLGGLLNE